MVVAVLLLQLSILAFAQNTCRMYSWERILIEPINATPPHRFDHGLTYDSASGRVFVSGGVGKGYAKLKDLWVFHLAEKRWTSINVSSSPVPPISDHSISFYKDQIIYFGGETDGPVVLGGTYIYHLSEDRWEELKPQKGRYGHSAEVHGDHLYIFGGRLQDESFTNELLLLDLTTKEWTNISTIHTPSPRNWFSTILYQNEIILFGGYNSTPLKDLWSFNIDSLSWTLLSSSTPLQPRSGHVAVLFEEKMIVVGGELDVGPFVLQTNDVWPLVVEGGSWELACEVGGSMPPRLGHNGETVVLEGEKVVLVFGGIATDDNWSEGWFFNDLWVLHYLI
eukprot:TRINITY_DN5263_c0_g1_i1.p1 TRINITY_DN5263_c0_g1~~TRINITY_DN5263_c0_g1_i1.p1  ORF type:complete len:337 (-),score=59.34 TRINITY_DN5263_c0_g1_i1:190-1200(-)